MQDYDYKAAATEGDFLLKLPHPLEYLTHCSTHHCYYQDNSELKPPSGFAKTLCSSSSPEN